MQTLQIHTIETAPEGSRDTLRTVQASLGMIPNLAAGMANAPTLVKAFFAVRGIYEQGTLSAADIQVLSLANAIENDCDWCVAFHSFVAEKVGVPKPVLEALRKGGTPEDARFKALVTLTRDLIRHRGTPTPASLEAFLAAGFKKEQALEVVLGVAFSTMANYAHHLVQAPLDAVLQPYAWSR